MEQQRALAQRAQRVAQASSRVGKVRADLDQRTVGLERAAVAAERKARALEDNLAAADAAIMAINAQLARGISWSELVRCGAARTHAASGTAPAASGRNAEGGQTLNSGVTEGACCRCLGVGGAWS